MRDFKEIYEATKYKIYMIDNTFWVAYGDGSGTTAQVNNLNSFLTDKSDDSHYDSIVNNVLKFAKDAKAIQSKKSKDVETKLYEMPMYLMKDIKSNPTHKISVWDGEIKPNKMYYMLLTKQNGTSIVNFFKSKSEAQSWIKSIA